MADSSTSADAQEIEINVRPPGGGDKKVPIKINTSKTVSELKQEVATHTDIPAENQRLIYSGRVLKDEEQVSVYKIRPGDTVHLVKGAAKAPPPPSTQQVPQNISAGNTIAGNPLAPLLNATNPGIGNFNPFADMGLNTNDPNLFQNMFQSPQAQEQMRNMLSNPAVIDQIIDSSPELRNMGPHVREIMQSEQFRNMLANPQQMGQMMQQAQNFRQMFGGNPPGMGGLGGAGGGGFGGDPWGAGAFGAAAAGQQGQAGQQAATGGAGTGTEGQNRGPTNLFNPPAQQQGAAGANPFGGLGAGGAGAGFGGAGGMPDFAALQQLLGGMGGMGGGFAGAPGGFGAQAGQGATGSTPTSPPPQDTRPPEERFASQLQTLNEMGFVSPQANIRALLACGGNVQAAIEYLLNSSGW